MASSWLVVNLMMMEIGTDFVFYLTGTRVIVGLNFGGNNVSMALRQTQSILKAFDSPAVRNSNIVLEAIEFGNEPDLYPNNGLRAKTYNSAQYTRE